jgi:glutamine amidotransferase
MKKVTLVDAGTGNLRSVQKALERLGVQVTRTDSPAQVLSGDRLVLPGVGAFGNFMAGLRARGLAEAIREVVSRQVPLLGICVGMQALFEVGEELGVHPGLGLIEGEVKRLEGGPDVKVPHTGWNEIEIYSDTPLLRDLPEGAYAYFNHSYYCQPKRSSDVIATTRYGITFTCAVQREYVFGVQFHPEKSQGVGLQILKNFLENV